MGSLNVGILGWNIDICCSLVVEHLGAPCVDWYTSGHLLCASTNCVHGVVRVPVNWYNIVTGGLCMGLRILGLLN